METNEKVEKHDIKYKCALDYCEFGEKYNNLFL